MNGPGAQGTENPSAPTARSSTGSNQRERAMGAFAPFDEWYYAWKEKRQVRLEAQAKIDAATAPGESAPALEAPKASKFEIVFSRVRRRAAVAEAPTPPEAAPSEPRRGGAFAPFDTWYYAWKDRRAAARRAAPPVEAPAPAPEVTVASVPPPAAATPASTPPAPPAAPLATPPDPISIAASPPSPPSDPSSAPPVTPLSDLLSDPTAPTGTAQSAPPPAGAPDPALAQALAQFESIFAIKDEEKRELAMLCDRIEALESQLSRTEEYVRSVILARRQGKPIASDAAGFSSQPAAPAEA